MSLKPGQKFSTPTPGFGDRVFYETLLRQRPDSFMAQEWCVNYGVLSHSEAERMNKKVLDAKKKGIKSGAISPPPKKKKVKVEHDIGGDADMSTGGPEMVGSKIM